MAMARESSPVVLGDSPCWSGTVGSGEEVAFVLVVDKGVIEGSIEQQFSGKYRVIGSRGVVEQRDAVFQPQGELELARYVFAAQTAALAVALVGLTTLFLWARRRRTRRASSSGGAQSRPTTG